MPDPLGTDPSMHARTAILVFAPLTAAVASGAFAQGPPAARPEPTQALVELFNQQDALQRQEFLAGTPISERLLLDVGGVTANAVLPKVLVVMGLNAPIVCDPLATVKLVVTSAAGA